MRSMCSPSLFRHHARNLIKAQVQTSKFIFKLQADLAFKRGAHMTEGTEHASGTVRLGLLLHALARRVVVVRPPVLADAA